MYFPYLPGNSLEEKIVKDVENALGIILFRNPFQEEDFPTLARKLKNIKNEKARENNFFTYIPEEIKQKVHGLEKLLLLAHLAHMQGQRFFFIIDVHGNILAKKSNSLRNDERVKIIEILHDRLLGLRSFYKMINSEEQTQAIENTLRDLKELENSMGVVAKINITEKHGTTSE